MNEWVLDGEGSQKREVPQQRNGQESLLVPSYFAPAMKAELVSLYFWWPLLPPSSEMSFPPLIFLALDVPAHEALMVTSSLSLQPD